MAVFILVGVQAFVRITRLEIAPWRLIRLRRCEVITASEPGSLDPGGDLIEQGLVVWPACINHAIQIIAFAGQTFLPVLALYPNGVDRTPVHAGNQKRILDMTRGPRLGRAYH